MLTRILYCPVYNIKRSYTLGATAISASSVIRTESPFRRPPTGPGEPQKLGSRGSLATTQPKNVETLAGTGKRLNITV